jgi:hypothetical protein
MPELVPHLVVIVLAVVEWTVILWYVARWGSSGKHMAARLVAWFILVLAVGAIPLAQLAIYRRMTGSNPLDDNVVFASLVVESVVALAIIFSFAYKQRRSNEAK